MDIDAILNGGYDVRNPNYNPNTKKGRAEQPYLKSSNIGDVHPFTQEAYDYNKHEAFMFNVADYDKYVNAGINLNTWETTEDWDRQLAESQSNWSKAANALAQTIVSEVGIGTVKAFSDIADGVLNGIGSAFFNSTNDYTNPMSKVLEEWKEKFDNEIAPIYTEDGVDISNGGLGNFGWWMKNIPSIASSLTLLLPGKYLISGASKLLGLATKGRATAKAMRGLRKLTGVESLTSAQTIEKVKQAENMIGTAIVMRTAENYQEARGTYNDMKEEVINKFNGMTPQQYSEWINNHKDYIEKNELDPNDKDAISDRIASDAANETFREDFRNVFFDIVQLWSLRDASKIFRNVKSTKVMADHRASIQALGKTSDELAEAAEKTTKFSRLGNTITDIIRGTGKAVIGESTEGIEEAVNYIAQQEGMTVGKTILDDLTPTSYGDRLSTYMSDPQLWESAFWGLAGGLVFQGLGSAYNQAQIKIKNNKEAKKREENSKTGEKVKTNKWYELEELPEIKAARQAVKDRQSRVEDMINKLSQINNGINIFGKRDASTKELPMFEGSTDAIALQQERARTSVIDQFVADITTDAIHSGTYDLLTEYLGSTEMTRAMAQKFNLNDSQATSFVQDLLNKSKRVKDEYNKQINHISNQVAAINADRKTKDSVPLPYIQLLAKQNLDRVLAGKNLDDQAKIIQEQINALKDNPALDGILDRSINYEDVMTIGSITNSYVNYESQKKAIQASDELGALDKMIRIDAINKKQKLLLDELESINTINGKTSSPLGRILYTLRSAHYFKRDESGNLVEDKDAIEKTDKEILKEHGFTVTDSEAEDAAKSFSEYEDTLSAFDTLVEVSKREINEADKAGKQLKEVSDQLYNRYKQIADIRIGKILNASDIATTKTQIAEQIDIIHNQNNKNRLAMIKKAEDKLLDLYTRYDRPVIDNLIAMALDGHQEQAKALAKEQLTDKSDDGVMFEDAFDILNINSDNNTQLASYVKRLIDGKEWIEHIQRLRNETGENSSTLQNSNSEVQSQSSNNQSAETPQTTTEQGNTLNQQQSKQNQQNKEQNQNVDGVINAIIKSVSQPAKIIGGVRSYIQNNNLNEILSRIDDTKKQIDSLKADTDNVRTQFAGQNGSEEAVRGNLAQMGVLEDNLNQLELAAFILQNDENTIRDKFSTISAVNRQVLNANLNDLIKIKQSTISSTGGEGSNPQLDALKKSLNDNFDYLEIKGEDDIEDNKDFDVEKAVNTVREQGLKAIDSFTEVEGFVVTEEAKNELRAILEDRVETLRNRLTKFKEEINKDNPTVDEAASALAMASKIGILGQKEQLPNLFVVGFEHFVDAYIKTAITPIKDGKKVISVQEILSIVSDVVADQAIADYLIEKMRKYLNSPEVAAKYVILDKDNLNKDFNVQNSTKDNEELEHQKEQFRVNILDYVEFYKSENATLDERKRFFEVLNRLRKGDKLDLVVDGNVLFIKSGDRVIGSITKAIFENNKFTKINKGWVEDVAVNAGGDIVSDTMEVYKNIFLSDEPNFVQLRYILIDAISNGTISEQNVKEFINSNFIQDAINFAGDSLIVNGGDDIETKARDMIEHLIRIYNYSTQGVVFKNKQERIDGITYAVENYFASLYNDYSILGGIDKNTKIEIEYINDGQVNKKFGIGTGHHDDLPFISKDIIKSKGKLGYFKKADGNGTTISGEQSGPVPPKAPDVLKVLAMYDRNDAISYVTVSQLRPSDYNSSSGYQKLFSLAKLELTNLMKKAVSDNTEEAYNNLAQAINNIIHNKNNDEDTIPLFIGFPRKGANFKYDRSKGEIQLYFFYNKGKEKPTRFSIFRNRKGFRFTYIINGVEKEIKGESNNFENTVINTIMNIIKDNSNINIDTKGINSDNNPSKDINKGFIHRKNGKIEVFGEEYDSYNDFIVNNGLARVDLNEPEDNSNFIAFRPDWRNQKLNQVMYVSLDTTLPVEENVDTTKYDVNKPSNKTTDNEVFDKVHKAFENTTTSGKDLFIAAYGQEAYNDMLNVAGEFDIMEAILPLSMVYNPNLNSAANTTLEAKTNPTNHRIRVNVGSNRTLTGRTRVELAPGQVMVGDKFISMLSSTKGPLRNRAIAVMIHERLHWLIENNPNYTRKEILDAITPIYDEFFKLCQEVVDNYNESTASQDEKLKYLRAKKAIEDFKKYNNKRTYPDPLTKFDEFLVETITNIDYNALMNDFKQTQQVEKGEDNIFTKLLKFVMKYLFNREVVNGSLLEQEFNILSKLVNNKQVEVPAEQKTISTIPANPERNKPLRRVVTNIRRPGDTANNRFKNFRNRHDSDSAIGIIEQYNAESITGFISTLPVEQQVKFRPLINNNRLKYTCVIK